MDFTMTLYPENFKLLCTKRIDKLVATFNPALRITSRSFSSNFQLEYDIKYIERIDTAAGCLFGSWDKLLSYRDANNVLSAGRSESGGNMPTIVFVTLVTMECCIFFMRVFIISTALFEFSELKNIRVYSSCVLEQTHLYCEVFLRQNIWFHIILLPYTLHKQEKMFFFSVKKKF